MSIEPILDSERDRRTWAWIIAQVGEDAARSVDLHGRRPFVSNIAKALGLMPPANLEVASRDTAQAHLEQIRKIMKGQG